MRYLSNRWTTKFFPLRSVQYVLAFAAKNEWTSSECVCVCVCLPLSLALQERRFNQTLCAVDSFFPGFSVPFGLNEFPICSVWRIYHVQIVPCAWETYTHLVIHVIFPIAVICCTRHASTSW